MTYNGFDYPSKEERGYGTVPEEDQYNRCVNCKRKNIPAVSGDRVCRSCKGRN